MAWIELWKLPLGMEETGIGITEKDWTLHCVEFSPFQTDKNIKKK